MYQMNWLADVLRAAGCTVHEQDGWKDRGRGDMGHVRGVLCHHTAGPREGNAPSLNSVLHGREDLPGPLSQCVLGRDGTWFVLAAGRCNHAGAGSWQGVTTGNSSFIGIEAENAGDGKDLWPAQQMEAYAKGVAAILVHLGEDSVMCAGHKEYALPKGRKIDPSFDMLTFRERVATYMKGEEPTIKSVAATDPRRSMLRKGDQGDDVKLLQGILGIFPRDGAFGARTEVAVKGWQHGHGLVEDGMVGPATWKSLGH